MIPERMATYALKCVRQIHPDVDYHVAFTYAESFCSTLASMYVRKSSLTEILNELASYDLDGEYSTALENTTGSDYAAMSRSVLHNITLSKCLYWLGYYKAYGLCDYIKDELSVLKHEFSKTDFIWFKYEFPTVILDVNKESYSNSFNSRQWIDARGSWVTGVVTTANYKLVITGAHHGLKHVDFLTLITGEQPELTLAGVCAKDTGYLPGNPYSTLLALRACFDQGIFRFEDEQRTIEQYLSPMW